MRSRLWVGCLAIVAAFAFVPTAGARSVAPDFFGISVPFVYDGTSDELREAYLNRIARLGVGSARLAISWKEIEPQSPFNTSIEADLGLEVPGASHHYRWRLSDERIALLARHGLRTYPVLNDSPGWTRGNGGGAFAAPRPAYIPHFAAFAAESARRYGPNGYFWAEHPELPYLPIHNWEIWNEPNLPYFWGELLPDAQQFAALLSAANDSIKLIQPEARVVMGGLSPREKPARFLRNVFSAQPTLAARIGYVGFHPYGGTPAGGLARIARFRAALDRYGSPAIAIEITEDGMTTLNDVRRKRYLARMAAAASASCWGISRYIVHTFVTAEQKRDEPEHYYGIAKQNGALKPSGGAFREAIATATGAAELPAEYRAEGGSAAPVSCRR